MRSPTARIALLVLALAVLVVAFVALRPGGGDEERTAPRATAPEARTTDEPAPPASTTGGTPAPPPRRRVPVVRVRGGEVVGERLEIEARAGEEVVFRVSSDVADEVHVHGYDVRADVRPGTPATVRLDAGLEGVFEVELHDAGVQVAELRVSPS